MNLFAVSALTLLVHAVDARAEAPFWVTYQNERATFQSMMDGCDLLNAREILALSSSPLLTLTAEREATQKLFDDTIAARQSCYTRARKALNQVLREGANYLATHEGDTLLARQLELDGSLQQAIDLRMKISHQLLRSMHNDIETAINTYIENGNRDKKVEAFYEESPLTRGLIKQDMDMILEMERRNLNLSEIRTVSTAPDIRNLTALKLAKAQHYFARALMAFEDMHLQPRLYPLARLNTEFGYANAQFTELFAFSPKLEGLSRDLARQLARTGDKTTLMALDIDGALRDIRNGDFTEDYDNWLSELYQEMSSLTLDLQAARTALASDNIAAPSLNELETAFDDVKTATDQPVMQQDEMPAHMLDGAARLNRLLTAQKKD